MRRLLHHPGLIFAVLVAWKLGLFLLTTQPIPSNDSFFYDGAAVNAWHGGAFVNPTVAIARPYSGTEFFSPYPPLYQYLLQGWMQIFGASARAAIALHLALMSIFALLVYHILRLLEIEPWAIRLAGAFLFLITFHDRPDTLAHVLGAGAIWGTVVWQRRREGAAELWGVVGFVALTFLTSVQLGATYLAVVGATIVAHSWITRTRWPWWTLIILGLTPFALLALGKFGFPRWWTGFLENARNNPSSQGLHLPDLDAMLKLVRSLPGLLLILICLIADLPRLKAAVSKSSPAQSSLLIGLLFGSFGVCGMSLCYLTANYLPLFGAFLQPLVVGVGLIWVCQAQLIFVPRSVIIAGCGAGLALGSLRAVGMSTWGLLCARDVSYAAACQLIGQELDSNAKAGSKRAVVSAAYLYASAAHREAELIHSDYLVPLRGAETESDLAGLLRLQPGRLLLTQFDYYRRYEPVIAELRRTRGDVAVHINNTARVQPPDAARATRKLIQHIAWAPVLVEIQWPNAAASR